MGHVTSDLAQQRAVEASQSQRGGLSGPQHPAGRAVPLDAAHLQTQEPALVSRADHQPLALPAHSTEIHTVGVITAGTQQRTRLYTNHGHTHKYVYVWS